MLDIIHPLPDASENWELSIRCQWFPYCEAFYRIRSPLSLYKNSFKNICYFWNLDEMVCRHMISTPIRHYICIYVLCVMWQPRWTDE